ncbi:TspO/MBR-related protein [Gymnopilus junonius]|uniref:TspO/MBR-related protein n=1 Tax=Gymnopilus junonius TaxID=109634 RepID=A0A9P5TTT9_GYMJU|nr:TspO/MBR-related protein [Gymnopilus junonius]
MSFHIPNILLAVPRNPVAAVGLPLALGFFSGKPTSDVGASNWYAQLKTPPGCPSREAFPFVWTLLYVSMGYASHVVVKALDNTTLENNRNALTLGLALYYAQLGLNVFWPPIFFVKRKIGLALLDSVLLTGMAWFMTKILDRPTNGKATYFLLPYCAWLGYATYLNAGIWWLNREPKPKPQ